MNRLKGTPTADKIAAILGDLTLEDIAVCPDEVREFERNPKNTLSTACQKIFPDPPKGTEQWHFVNTPIKGDTFTATERDVTAACKQICAVNQIPFFLAILQGQHPTPPGGKSQPDFTKAQALSFIVHFIGDIHQPLHSADRNGDEGGNAEHVSFFGNNSLVLHGIWDNQIVAKIDKTPDALFAGLSSDIIAAGAEPIGTPMTWTLEAYIPARDTAYKGIDEEPKVAKNEKPPIVATLGQSYQDAAAPVVKQQISRAGVRLAASLTTALGGAEAKSPKKPRRS
jgi:hypothetical protein